MVITDEDHERLGNLAMEALDCLEEYGEDARLGDAIIIFDVDLDDRTHTNWRATTDRAVIRLGLVEMASEGLKFGGPVEDEEPEET
jgi:hypothetical protein